MVPMFTQIPPPNTPNHIPKMDVLSQKVCFQFIMLVDCSQIFQEILLLIDMSLHLFSSNFFRTVFALCIKVNIHCILYCIQLLLKFSFHGSKFIYDFNLHGADFCVLL